MAKPKKMTDAEKLKAVALSKAIGDANDGMVKAKKARKKGKDKK